MRSPEPLNSEAFFEKAFTSFTEDRPFVIYSKPDSDRTVGIFQQDTDSRILSSFDDEGYVFAPFSGKDVAFIPFDRSDLHILEDRVQAENVTELPVTHEKPEIDPTYKLVVERAIKEIQHQQFQKVVISRKEQLTLDRIDFIQIYKRLLTMYPDSYTYCWYQPATGMWLGAFKEQLAKVTATSLNTMALAGTKPWTEGKTNWGSKELAEQKYVTTFIVDRITGLATDITTGPLSTVRAGAVVHLRTDIQAGIADGVGLQKVVDSLHPTPAVCGLPQEEAMQFILQNEGYDRGYYSGYHGEINQDVEKGLAQSDLYVNLRCMQLSPVGNGGVIANIFVGGGITADSDPQDEWQETVNKATTMKKVLFN